MACRSGRALAGGLRACPLIQASCLPDTTLPPGLRTLAYRGRTELPFDASTVGATQPIMLDTTVYLDALKSLGLPKAIQTLLVRNVVLHCAIACAELAVSTGHLDPAHSQTAAHRAPLVRHPAAHDAGADRCPQRGRLDRGGCHCWYSRAGSVYARENRRAVLNDALMLLTATEAGAMLISRNIRHMDLLLRFRPDAQVLLYDRPGSLRSA